MDELGKRSADRLEQSRQEYENGYYERKLKQGLAFQDFVVEELYRHGLIVVTYASKQYQQRRGENMLGAEIKNDEKWQETDNLYIECEEKAHPDNPNFVPAGIFREDNSWLYVIGDRTKLWVFSIKMLRGLAKLDRYRKVTKPTSRAFLLPLPDADKYAAKVIVPSKDTTL